MTFIMYTLKFRIGTMPQHRYQQYCALARTLDVAGDRWTLLIVRELAPGPRRFTDLLDGLPGVSRNLLTERLRALERAGIISRHELPPPAVRRVYELTDDGSIEFHDGRVEDPAVTWTTDEETWADVASGKITASSAAAAGVLTIAGDSQAAKRLRKIFSRSQMVARARATIDRA